MVDPWPVSPMVSGRFFLLWAASSGCWFCLFPHGCSDLEPSRQLQFGYDLCLFVFSGHAHLVMLKGNNNEQHTMWLALVGFLDFASEDVCFVVPFRLQRESI